MYNDIPAGNTDYTDQFYRPQNAFLEALRRDGESRDIPIIRKDAEMFLRGVFSFFRPRRILEIGTAFGYSALFFACMLPEATITTLEIKQKSVTEANENIKRADEILKKPFASRIEIIHGDATDTLAAMQGNFDMVFMDGPKAHYLSHFKLLLPLTLEDALIVSDNILLGGMLSGEVPVARRNLTMTRRMDAYLRYITELDGYETSVIPMGDGIALTWKKGKTLYEKG